MGIHAIATHLRRSNWYRLWYKWLKKLSVSRLLMSNDRLFWLWLDEQIQENPEKIVPILWLELPTELADYRNELSKHVAQMMRTSTHAMPQIWCSSDQNSLFGITTTHAS
ncbi:MAG: hypothetical protein HC912_02340 [Saprospiraceae bacterium]|nr:hypothetical protein [Saprospiraceae bacterium]